MPKTPRISVRFYDPGDGTPVKFQAIHWSPPRKKWSPEVIGAVEKLVDHMKRHLNDRKG